MRRAVPAAPPRAGEVVPEFSGRTTSGSTITRTDLLGQPSVLFFYPKAGSPGCSREAREFARRFSEFQALGVKVVGISVDRPDAQERFKIGCALPFDLIADATGEIARSFGVLGPLGLARRVTFLMGANGRVLRVVRAWRPRRHAAAALDRLAPRRAAVQDRSASPGEGPP